MRTPKKISAQGLADAIDSWLKENCDRQPDGSYLCRKCDATICAQDVYFLVHFKFFPDTCGGAGEFKRFGIPFCPLCEDAPEAYGCVHIDAHWPTDYDAAVSV